ncbi:DUF2931 family protein [Siccibacter turicensis]|uniref:DUF2931 domain-containing protein n=1 Tax=Siccibacter turicensis TaxID=357233 RepID=A0A2P8VEG8_9ENTR|nr:DUF2931 family protein [Siccibacter turicensis]PSN05943.1 hypothetical protein C7G83_19290 [Siccibacter turicensis]
MRRYFLLAAGMLLSLTACSDPLANSRIKWDYGTGSNIDITNNVRTEFYRDGKLIYVDRLSGGGAGGLLSDRIERRKYYWAGGGGVPVSNLAVPDKASIEIVSHYDKKRYRIVVNLPKDLEQQMRQRYRVAERTEQCTWLYFGLAPGGYYEVLLFGGNEGVSPDKLLARGIATEVTDDWYDKKVSVSEQYGLNSFDEKYGELYKKHPIPTGMEWAPIMDAYRAKQPKTDQHPVN